MMTQEQQFTHRWPDTLPEVMVEAVEQSSSPKKPQQPKIKNPRTAPSPFPHEQLLDMMTVSLIVGGAIAQGVFAKLDGQGMPATEAYWIAVSIGLPFLFLMAAKSGNQALWRFLCKAAIAISVSPGAAQVLHIVFGG